MYHCENCGKNFAVPEILTETHQLDAPPYEKRPVCPHCLDSSITEVIRHCRCCGAKMRKEGEFCCEACRKRSLALWENEKKRRHTQEPINRVLRKKEAYNRRHGTKYSYGQYVALGEKRDV